MKRWDGHPAWLQRLAEALALLSPDTYDSIIARGQCIHHFTRGAEKGFELWDLWCRGGDFMGVPLPGRTDLYNASMMRDKWLSFDQAGAGASGPSTGMQKRWALTQAYAPIPSCAAG